MDTVVHVLLVACAVVSVAGAFAAWRSAVRAQSPLGKSGDWVLKYLEPYPAFEGGRADALVYALCPAEDRVRPHALRADDSLRCWDCGHEQAGGR